MNVIVVDDERLILTTETIAIQKVLPKANVVSFRKAKEAEDYAEYNKVDIAFLDINMKGMSGLQLAEQMKAKNPRINIIFCTGYSEYSMEALDLYCSAYLMKPLTEEKIVNALSNLRYPVADKDMRLKAVCFGNFEVFYNDKPLKFKQKKTRELLAYLIDRRGATVSTSEIIVALYEQPGRESFVRNLRSDLSMTLESLGLGEVIVREGKSIGINPEKINCDFYEYLAGNKSLFNGEYMSQYSFAEMTLGWLVSNS